MSTKASRAAASLLSFLGSPASSLLVYLIGFPLTVPLFMFFYLKFQSEASWLQSLALTAITWVLFHLLFQRLVHIQFESGAIQTWLGMYQKISSGEDRKCPENE